MKTKKTDLDTVVKSGSAQIETRKRVGRPASVLPKKQVAFHLPVNIIQAIDDNSLGNKSAFAEKVFKWYFMENNIQIPSIYSSKD